MQRAFIWTLFLFINIQTYQGQTTRSLHSCTSPLCTNTYIGCTTCYQFTISNGSKVCAPATSCDSFDACTVNKTCVSSASYCIEDSCCQKPICLPRVLTEMCRINNSINNNGSVTTTSLSSNGTCNGSGKIFEVPDECINDGGINGVADSLEIYCVFNRARFCLSREICPWRNMTNNANDDGKTCSTSGLQSSYMANGWCNLWRNQTNYYCYNGTIGF